MLCLAQVQQGPTGDTVSAAGSRGRTVQNSEPLDYFRFYPPQLPQHKQLIPAAGAPIIRSESHLSFRDPSSAVSSKWSLDSIPNNWSSGENMRNPDGLVSAAQLGSSSPGVLASIGAGGLIQQWELDALIARNAARMAVLNRALATAAAHSDADTAAPAATAGEAMLERYLLRQHHELEA